MIALPDDYHCVCAVIQRRRYTNVDMTAVMESCPVHPGTFVSSARTDEEVPVEQPRNRHERRRAAALARRGQ